MEFTPINITTLDEKVETYMLKTVGNGGRSIKPYWVFVGWHQKPREEQIVKETKNFIYYNDGDLMKYRKM